MEFKPVAKKLVSPKVLIPVGIVALAGLSYHFVSKREKQKKIALTPERKAVYEGALTSLKHPTELRKLADSFETVGLPEHAVVLRKRATLRELPPEIQALRKKEFQYAMSQTDPHHALRYADAFSDTAAFSAANHLRKYAAALASNEPEVIQRTILDLEKFEKGQTRSLAHQNAVRNLRERVTQLNAGGRLPHREPPPSLHQEHASVHDHRR